MPDETELEQSEWFDFGSGPSGKKTIITAADAVIGPFGGDNHTIFFSSTNPGNPRIEKRGNKLYFTTGKDVLAELVFKEPELQVFATNISAKKALGFKKKYVTPKGYVRQTY